ncbi:hypothetical protein BRDID11002_72270 [Bradyrhizobium diazoefficiens]
MARDSQAALVALNRFGLGARGGASGDLINAASDPRGFVKAELARPNGVLLEAPGLQSTPQLGQAVFAYQDEVKQAREAAAKAGTPPEAPPLQAPADQKPGPRRNLSLNTAATEIAGQMAEAKPADAAAKPETMQPNMAAPPAAKPAPQPLNVIQKTFRAEALARLQRATLVECGFTERLVVFWSNHFCISASKGELARIWAGAFEREAIRPHVLGRFADMLKAVEQHPAMLFFLDNQQSLGPDSRAGQNRKRGLNENLAREIMELHTLGVGGGYTQEDVTSLARIITGWTFAGRQGGLGTPGSFAFNVNAHQPGPQVLLGKTYEPTGLAQGEAALADIARHPSTANFIATKLVRHFVADDPPQALVARLRDVFVKTDGDLKAMATALVDSDEAWKAPLTKMRSPYDFLVASGRLLARVPEDPGAYLNGLNLLGQPLWSPSGPNGFPDTVAAWAAPEGMKLRLDIAAQMGARLGNNIEPARPAGIRSGRRGVDRNAADHRARGIAPAGAGAAADVAGNAEEMMMIDCVENRLLTSRRGLLLGGASFAAWAYLPKFARAADGRDPRLIVVILRGALDGLSTVAPVGDPDYAGLHGSIALAADGAHPRDHARFLLRAASGYAGVRAHVSRHACRSDPRGGDTLSRPFAFRRPGRARKRLCRPRPGAVRLAQPRAGSAAARRARVERPCGRADHAAGAARQCADRRLGAGGAAAGRRRHRDAARRSLPSPRSRVGDGPLAGPPVGEGRKRRRHEAEGRQSGRADAPGRARRRQADGGRRRPAHRRARLRRLGYARQ